MSNSVCNDILGVIAIAMFVAWYADIPPIGDREVITYNVDCESCKPSEMNLYRQVFRADPVTLTVTSWVKGGGRMFIYRNCAIRDKKNWKCDIDDDSAPWRPEMNEGSFGLSPLYSTAVEVSWYKWWWLRLIAIAR